MSVFDEPKQPDRQQRILERKRDRERADLKTLLESEAGRRFIWRILTMGKAFDVPAHQGTHEDHIINGKKLIGAAILKDVLEVNGFEILGQMLKEAQQKEQEDLKL